MIVIRGDCLCLTTAHHVVAPTIAAVATVAFVYKRDTSWSTEHIDHNISSSNNNND